MILWSGLWYVHIFTHFFLEVISQIAYIDWLSCISIIINSIILKKKDLWHCPLYGNILKINFIHLMIKLLNYIFNLLRHVKGKTKSMLRPVSVYVDIDLYVNVLQPFHTRWVHVIYYRSICFETLFYAHKIVINGQYYLQSTNV